MYTTRCFIAVPVGPPASSVIGRLLGKLGTSVPDVKWTRFDQLHLTIKFLGELDNRDLLKVGEELRRACAETEPFSISLSGIGTFPKNKPAKVVWAGVQEGSAILESLYLQLDQGLSAIGLPKEGKMYKPHLTLGRVGRGGDLELLAQKLQAIEPDVESVFDVDEILIYASIREKSGMVYEPIDTVEL
jgi:RNA 2',3'-cyclic 3'-phosphodiesterase